ncbi:Metallophosphoesterase domain-containing protein 1-like [Oopsacas minuta]|uniref:cytidine deaminase n=1 Tax=Oopsacas minuta TaxID=111878 RepID=A0AAV7K8U4_9METZ|nr:Metallophosphoesterase domain-containing protein 1-like [Oopsacas minuta]
MAAKCSAAGSQEFIKSLPYQIVVPKDVTIIPPRVGSSEIKLNKLTGKPDEAWLQIQKEPKQKVEVMKIKDPLCPPRDGYTRFVCISDTHSHTDKLKVPSGDVLIHAGDFSNIGHKEDVVKFNSFLGSLPHRYKVVIAGNHDLSLDTEEYPKTLWMRFSHKTKLDSNEMKSLISNGLYLEDFGCELLGFKIYGSPWQPEFFSWGFNLKRGQPLLDKWNKIPDNVDILITHGPPIGHGDLCNHGGRAGCVELLSTIQNRVKPKVHVFGHIHEGYASHRIRSTHTRMLIVAQRYLLTLMSIPSNDPSDVKVPTTHQHLLLPNKEIQLPPDVEKALPELIEACIEAKSNSYSPYSKFRVGASLLTNDGMIYRGCNVENASYGLCVCAEVCAYVKAVSDGYREFRAIAVNTDMVDSFAAPCGACRQFILEFGEYYVIIVRPDKQYKIATITELLPYSFSGADLKKERIQH